MRGRSWLGGYLLLMAYLCTGNYGSGANPGLWNEITNAGHYPAFFVGSLVFSWALWSFFSARLSTRVIILSGGLFSSALAILVEVIQPFFGRSQSTHDALLGICGAAAASAGGWIYLNRKSLPFPKAFLLSYAVFCCFLGVSFALPVFDEYRAIQLRKAIFPVLSNFQDQLQLRLWSTNYEDPRGWRASIVRGGKTPSGEPSLVVGTVPGKYSGARYSAMDSDWSKYQELIVDVLNPNGEFPISVRIDDDGKAYKLSERFNQTFPLPSGKSSISIPIREIQAGGGSRELDLTKIRFVYLFTSPDQPARVFYILGARLR